jgi:hypothetical protein
MRRVEMWMWQYCVIYDSIFCRFLYHWDLLVSCDIWTLFSTLNDFIVLHFIFCILEMLLFYCFYFVLILNGFLWHMDFVFHLKWLYCPSFYFCILEIVVIYCFYFVLILIFFSYDICFYFLIWYSTLTGFLDWFLEFFILRN